MMMVEKKGKIQEVTLREHGATIRVGKSPTHTRRLTLAIEGTPGQQAFCSGMVDTLIRAMMAGQVVTAWHDDESDVISRIELTAR
jgi:hypothetical protein